VSSLNFRGPGQLPKTAVLSKAITQQSFFDVAHGFIDNSPPGACGASELLTYGRVQTLQIGKIEGSEGSSSNEHIIVCFCMSWGAVTT
jgi:hypothetical protein